MAIGNQEKRRCYLRKIQAIHGFMRKGQSGSGKTHICTAICTRFISCGRSVRYKVWRNLFHELQSNQFDETEYKK